MSLLIWIVVGAIAGWLASMVMNTDAQQGGFANIVIGMIGSLIGGFLYTLLFRGDADFTTAFTSFNLASILVSTVGAIVFLAIVKALR